MKRCPSWYNAINSRFPALIKIYIFNILQCKILCSCANTSDISLTMLLSHDMEIYQRQVLNLPCLSRFLMRQVLFWPQFPGIYVSQTLRLCVHTRGVGGVGLFIWSYEQCEWTILWNNFFCAPSLRPWSAPLFFSPFLCPPSIRS